MKPVLALSLLMLSLIAYARPPVHHTPQMRRIIQEMPWQNIAAGGVAAGTVVAAYKLSNGVEEGLQTVAKEKPEAFISKFSWLSTISETIMLIAVLAVVGFAVWLFLRRISHKKMSALRKPRNHICRRF
ncbi:MAG: hypothetical protein AB7F40_10705 [Victivallaceae bacterium]